MNKLTTTLFLFSFIFFTTFSFAQTDSNSDINKSISKLSKDAATGYVNPAISSFGSNLNTGWVTKAPEPTIFSFNLNVKIIAMGSFIGDNDKTFSTNGSFRFTGSQVDEILNTYVNNGGFFVTPQDRDDVRTQMLNTDFNVGIFGPTIFGSKDENVTINFQGQDFTAPSGTKYSIPNTNVKLNDTQGFDLPIFPTAAIQFGIGTVYGTSIAVRWFPTVKISSDLGDFSYWGIGGIHNPAVWFGQQWPLDVAVGYFYQDLKVGTIFETKATMLGIYGSKTFGSVIAFTPYFAFTTESSTTTVNYDYTYTDGNGLDHTDNLNFELDGQNSAAFTIGAAFKLAILNLNVDYKFAHTKTASAGLTFGF